MANNDYDMEIEELLHKKAEIERKLAGEDDSSDDDRYSDVSSDSEEPTAKRSCPFRGNGRDSEGSPSKDRRTLDDNKDSDNEDDDKESTCSFVSSPSRSRCSSAVLANHATYDDDERSDVDEDNSESSPSSSKKENVADFDAKLAQKLTKKLANGVAAKANPKGEHLSSQELEDFKKLHENWKTILEKKENDHFGKLPDGWTRIPSDDGVRLYFHSGSSVATRGRPYLVSALTARYHNAPLSAIPCLHQKRIDEKAQEQAAQKENQPAEGNVETALNPLASLPSEDTTIEMGATEKHIEELRKLIEDQGKKLENAIAETNAFMKEQFDTLNNLVRLEQSHKAEDAYADARSTETPRHNGRDEKGRFIKKEMNIKKDTHHH